MMVVLQLGPAGGTGGKRFENYSIPEGARVTVVHIYTDWVVDALGLDYVMADGTSGSLPPIGSLDGQHHVFKLNEGEYLTGISGRYGWYIDAIRFHTNQRTSDLFGGDGGVHDFDFQGPHDYEVTGLFGRADWYLDALGAFVRPVAVWEEIVEGTAIATETEAEWTAEVAEEILDEMYLEVANEIEAELSARHATVAGSSSLNATSTQSETPRTAIETTDPGIRTAAEVLLLDNLASELDNEVEAEMQAGEEEAILAAVVDSVIGIDRESESASQIEEAWLTVGESQPVEAAVAVRREVVADQARLDELEEAVMAEAIAAYGANAGPDNPVDDEGAVDITLYTQIVEDEASGQPMATVMAVATDAGGHEATGDQPDEAAVMVTDNIAIDEDVEAMEEEAVDGAIMALVEDTGAISEDIDVTIYTAIGNDQTTGETYAAVVAIASEVKPEPSQKKPAKKTATTAKKPQGKKDATSREARPADLQKIEGIGPKIAELLIQNGILDLADLAQTPAERIREILAAGGTRFNRADPTTWAEQAALGAAGDWDKLQALQARLTAGR